MYFITCTIFQLNSGTCGFDAVRGVISRTLCSGDSSNEWQNVLDYWFGPGAQNKWFHGGPQVDEEIRQKFGFMVSFCTCSLVHPRWVGHSAATSKKKGDGAISLSEAEGCMYLMLLVRSLFCS